jgi:S-adenosylmethionine synthetase
MTEIIAAHLSLPIHHVIPDASKPIVKAGQTERPENTQLSMKALSELGIDVREDESFGDWWGAYIKETKKV